jgi:outer membrane protein assembly factor BamB
MANDTSRNPWALDTAAVITTQNVRVHSLRWVSAAAVAGHTISIEDNNGEKIWESVATGGNYVEAHDIDARCMGFELAQISSGVLYVYV